MAVTKIRGNTQIIDGSIVNAQINASAAIDESKLNLDYGTSSLNTAITNHTGDTDNPHSVTKAQVLSGDLIVNADVDASAAIAFSKLAALTDGNLLIGNSSNVATSVATSGDIALSNAGVFSINSGVIVNADVNASAAIDFSKLAALTDGNILVGDGSNVAVSVTPSGDVTLSNAGVFGIATGAIVDTDINASAAIALSKLAEAVIQADGGQAFTGDQSLGGFKLTSVGDPASGTDAANKNYVDGIAQGLDVKDSCRLASHPDSNWTTSVAIAFSAGTLTITNLPAGSSRGLIDSVEPVDTDRILLKDCGAAGGAGGGEDNKYNGIWQVTGGSTTSLTLTRTSDADEDAEVTAGLFTFVEEGTENADNGYVVTTNDPITVNTTAIVFGQFSGAGQITAGNALTKSGNTINFVPGDASLVANADEAHVQLDATAGTIALGGAGLQIADGTSGHILIGQGGGTDTAFKAVSGDISLAADGTTAIASGVIVDADVNASAAIAYSKLAALTDGNILVGNVSNVATSVTPSGDVTLSNAGVFGIATGAIVNADVNASAAIAYSKLDLSGSILNADINASAAIALSKLEALTDGDIIVGSGADVATAVTPSGDVTLSNAGVFGIATGVIVNADVNASAAIDFSKLAALTDGNILVGNVSNVAASVTPSGDVTLSNAGVFGIATGAIVNADVNASAAIAYSKLDLSGSILNADINASAAIDFSKLAALTDGNILVGSGANVATSVAVSGDATLANDGTLTLASTVLKEADIVTREVPSGTINGINVTFTLANTPVAGTEHVYLNGILQNEGGSNDYTISGGTITYNTAPQTGDILIVSYWK